MEQIFQFALTVIVISASGVMAPGPLFAANVSYGLRGGTKTGLKMAIGHTVVELPLVILLGIGVFSLENFTIGNNFRDLISIFGAIALFVFAFLQIKTIFKKDKSFFSESKRDPIIVGIALSALNPFFIMWWLTIGFKLISDAMLIWAFAGIFILFVLHIWMDFVWLGTVSYLASKSRKIISNKNYKILMVGLSIMLVYFGITYLEDVFSSSTI
ncbi:MAG: LysE family translocator [Nitrosopumilus sp.]|uniref:LysE family transporter n=1 Tax=Nitrosopumilus sp. TaxID=2024843 RepID=UPI00247B6514|nr:LysE family transporter [Nitrosopumilus sp.]MCV0391909.1 LysE family translocator [Nitrosopumilus sp.]